MRFAYADPPYPGQAHLYKNHPDFAGEVDHAQLIERLQGEFVDGWALSTSAAALGDVLALCPRGRPVAGGVRVCAWIRGVVPRPPARVMWTWEPVIYRTSKWRLRHEHDFVRDTLTAMQPSGFLGGQIKGAKPVAFCHWIFDLLGLDRDDELVDLFPGSGAVTAAWEKWRAQATIFDGAVSPEPTFTLTPTAEKVLRDL